MTAVLILEDSLTVRMDLVEALEAAGIESIACATLAEARHAIRTIKIACAILDLQLPDGTSLDLVGELRANPRFMNLPIVMLSSAAEVKDRLQGLALGATEYVGKPYDTDALVARVRGYISDHAPVSTRRRMLVIDDSATYRKGLGAALEQAGYRVLEAPSGLEGIKLAAQERPDAVIVDGFMPDMDGPSVIRRIRLDPALRTTPCVLLTGANDAAAEIHALEAGADAFVGKTADIEIILARVAAVLRTSPEPAGDLAASLLAPRRVLVVDDSATYLESIGAQLREDGYDAVLCTSGEEALDLLAVQSVDCILLDPVMPGISGSETCRRIKGAPGLREVPLIMVTAHDGKTEMIEGLAAGADDFLSKSVGFEVLRARVKAQIRRRQLEADHRRAREHALRNKHLMAQATELAQTNERIVEANRLKSVFLANMSHELRTPLNAIIGFAEVLLDGYVEPTSPEHTEFLGDILTSGRHLLRLINDVLDLAKVEAGKLEFRPEPCSPRAILEEICTILRTSSTKSSVTITLAIDPAIDPVILDPGRLKQVAYNFLSNALKFTPPGGTIVVRVTAEGAAHFRLEVEDSGAGIAEADLTRLFSDFQQLAAGSEARHGGTGLGLSLTRQLVEAQGGTVGVTSTLGVGSTFFAVLPRTT